MKDLLIWIVIWYAVWGSFNLRIRWSLEQFKSRKYIGRGLFFLSSTLFAFYYYSQHIYSFTAQIIWAVLIANLIGLFLGLNDIFFKKFKKDRYFILFQVFNILFQQTMVIIAISLLKENFTNYKDYYFGIMFFLVHLPVLFLPWARLKVLYTIYALFGGFIFSYLLNNFSFGVILNFLFHYSVYIWTIYYIKDEEKI